MKRPYIAIMFCFLWFGVTTNLVAPCYARDMVRGEITDAIRERVALSTGDKVTISVGRNQGLIKGDIGRIISRIDSKLEIGRCVIEESRSSSSSCQIVESLREIGRGDGVLFPGVDFRDKALTQAVVDFLDSSVKPFPTHEKVKILIHEIFDTRNNITQFSEKVRNELILIGSQKKRIVVTLARQLPDFSYYPNEYAASAPQLKNFLKNNGFDLVLTGSHVVNGNSVELTLQRIGQGDNDRAVVFPLLAGIINGAGEDKVVLPYVKREKHADSTCTFVYKTHQYIPLKEEKSAIIKEEAAANPFKELNLKRVEFNIISPVDLKVTVDGVALNLGENGATQISLGHGSHRIHASFKRGYYSGESLLYTSNREHSRDVVLELNKGQDLSIEVTADPVPDKGDHVVFKVYRKIEKERHALRPVQQMQSEKLIDTFVE
jgi:hypothetical protein